MGLGTGPNNSDKDQPLGICRTTGCEALTTGYSAYCGTHKRCKRRHGHPEQQSITAYALGPYQKRVVARIAKNLDNPAWGLLRSRWEALVVRAREELQRCQDGAAYNTYERDAWSNVEKVGASVEPLQVIEVVLSMYLLQHECPHRFKDDAAFAGQLVRRVRALAPGNAGVYFDVKTGKQKGVYRDAKPKTTEVLAGLLQVTFGGAGLTVARLEQQEVKAVLEEKKALHSALEALA